MILSLFAIVLLTSAQALNLPSSADVLRKVQRRHSAVRASVHKSISSLHTHSADLNNAPEILHQLLASYDDPTGKGLMQEDEEIDAEACAAAMNQSCIANIATQLLGAMGAADLDAAEDLVTEFCEACEDPAAQVATLIEDCALNGTEVASANGLATFAGAGCEDAACAAGILWGSAESRTGEEMRTAYCGEDCARPILSAFMNITGTYNESQLTCAGYSLDLLCLTDETDTSMYCSDLVMGEDGPENITALCATTCPGYLTVITEEMNEQCAGMMDDDDESNSEEEGEEECDGPTLNDICTVNEDGDFCYYILMNETLTPNVSECPALGEPFMIPAPGFETDTTNCSAECSGQLEETVAPPRGCCYASMFYLSCPAEELDTFITETCGVEFEACTPPPLPAMTGEEEDSGDEDTAEVDAAPAFTGVSVGVLGMAVAASFITTL